MRKQITNSEDAMFYLLECTLATVAHMAQTKSRPTGEFRRQKNIAQEVVTAINLRGLIHTLDKLEHYPRVYAVLFKHANIVEDWTRQYDVKLT